MLKTTASLEEVFSCKFDKRAPRAYAGSVLGIKIRAIQKQKEEEPCRKK